MQRIKSYCLLLVATLVYLGIPVVSGATAFWVNDGNDCPSLNASEFPGQDCTPDDICGDTSGTAQCYTPPLTAPSFNTTSTTNQANAFDGGYIINCFVNSDASAPYCDNSGNYWCDRNSTHYTTWHRKTICLGTGSGGGFGANVAGDCRTDGGGWFACDGSIEDADGCEIDAGASCGSGTGTIQLDECFDSNNGNCTRISDYLDCNNDDSDNNNITCNGGDGCEINPLTTTNNSNSVYLSCTAFQCSNNGTLNGWLDCDSGAADPWGGAGLDANGCEIQNNSACSVGAISGTINMCSGGSGNCVVDPQDIATTGEEVIWSGINPMLWLTQLGSGLGINMTFSNNLSFTVNSSGAYWDGQNLLGAGAESDPVFSANFTNMQEDCPTGNYSYGFYGNGTQKCRDDLTGEGAVGNPFDQDLNTTDGVTFVNVTLTGTPAIEVPQRIGHTGDPNTYFEMYPDQFLFTAGGISILQLLEGSNDYIRVGSSSQEVDLNVTIGTYYGNGSGITSIRCENIIGDDTDFCNDDSGSGSNETERVSNMIDDDCPAGNYSYGFQANGTILCRSDEQGAGSGGDGTGGWENSTGHSWTSNNVTVQSNLSVIDNVFADDFRAASSHRFRIWNGSTFRTILSLFETDWIFGNGCSVNIGTDNVLTWGCTAGDTNFNMRTVDVLGGNLSVGNTGDGGGYLFVEKDANITEDLIVEELTQLFGNVTMEDDVIMRAKKKLYFNDTEFIRSPISQWMEISAENTVALDISGGDILRVDVNSIDVFEDIIFGTGGDHMQLRTGVLVDSDTTGDMDLKATTTIDFQVLGTEEMSIDTNNININSNNLIMGTGIIQSIGGADEGFYGVFGGSSRAGSSDFYLNYHGQTCTATLCFVAPCNGTIRQFSVSANVVGLGSWTISIRVNGTNYDDTNLTFTASGTDYINSLKKQDFHAGDVLSIYADETSGSATFQPMAQARYELEC